jgi:putative transposase
MPRANRYIISGQVYHLTHRCHNRQFLLKFARDRDAYRMKLRQAVAQFELSLLDHCLTSNHVHLLACAEDPEQISGFMQMAAGECAQSYNRRKQRRGAYWEDRFHSTMIEPGGHLERCMVYIALNMVRCGVVSHPREWPWCRYQELMGLRQRFRILDFERVLALLGGVSAAEFRQHYEALIKERIAKDERKREAQWTEAIAVGSEKFVREMAAVIKGRQQL